MTSLVSKAYPDLREVNETAEQIARQSAGRLVKNISATKRKAVRALTGRALAEGWSDEMLAQRIAEVVGLGEREMRAVQNYRAQLLRDGVPRGVAATRTKEYRDRARMIRARLIARTEVAAALAQGQRVLWSQQREDGEISPYAVRVSRSHRDVRMCNLCRKNDGRKRSLKHTVGGPPYHPGCRCWEEVVDQGSVEYVIKSARYKPDAKDGDGDGFVQDGTPYERPAVGRLSDRIASAADRIRSAAGASMRPVRDGRGSKQAQDRGESYFGDRLGSGEPAAVKTKIEINDHLWQRLTKAHSEQEMEALWQRYTDDHLALEDVDEQAVRDAVISTARRRRDMAQEMYDRDLERLENLDDLWEYRLQEEYDRMAWSTKPSTDEEIAFTRTMAESNLKRERDRMVDDRIMWLNVIEQMDSILSNPTPDNPAWLHEYEIQRANAMEGNESQTGPEIPYRQDGDTEAQGFLRTVLRRVIDTWAQSSGDHNSLSVAVQDIAQERYGIKGWAHGGTDQHDTPKFWERDGGDWAHEEYQRFRYGAYGEAIGMVLDQMYENTQERLREAGITELRMWRGMKMESTMPGEVELGGPTDDRIKPGDAILEQLADKVVPGSPGDPGSASGYFGSLPTHPHLPHTVVEDVDLVSAPLASWTTHRPTAVEFAGWSGGGRQVSMIAEAVIPAERIFGSALTAMGCLEEREFVVLGGEQKVTGHYVWNNNIGWKWVED